MCEVSVRKSDVFENLDSQGCRVTYFPYMVMGVSSVEHVDIVALQWPVLSANAKNFFRTQETAKVQVKSRLRNCLLRVLTQFQGPITWVLDHDFWTGYWGYLSGATKDPMHE